MDLRWYIIDIAFILIFLVSVIIEKHKNINIFVSAKIAALSVSKGRGRSNATKVTGLAEPHL